MRWTADDIGDLSGKTAVVTGATSGTGRVIATELARHGATVLLAVRNTEAGRRVAAQMAGHTQVEELDLASLGSVRSFAERVAGPIDLLVNNAGVMQPQQYRTTVDGHELQFGTNHLGHFALTAGLLPALLAAPAPRVTTVSSIAHRQGSAAVLEANPAAGYQPGRTYGNSKLANLLFALELQRRAAAAKAALTSTAAHPGVAVTNLVANPEGMGSRWLFRTVVPRLMRLVLPGPEGGAQPILYAALVAEPGSYCGPTGPGELRGGVGPAHIGKAAADPDLARRLWTLSEQLTGVRFAF